MKTGPCPSECPFAWLVIAWANSCNTHHDGVRSASTDGHAWLTPASFGRWLEEVGIEPQSGDQTDMLADGPEQIDGGKTAVGEEHQVAGRQPTLAS